MIYHDLNEKNFLLPSKHYNNPQCVDVEEFNDDLRKIKYIKRLFNQYHTEGTLKERLILNHLIVFYNVFPTKTLEPRYFFTRLTKFSSDVKNIFIISQSLLEDKVESINGKEILTTNIPMDQGIIDTLREFDRSNLKS